MQGDPPAKRFRGKSETQAVAAPLTAAMAAVVEELTSVPREGSGAATPIGAAVPQQLGATGPPRSDAVHLNKVETILLQYGTSFCEELTVSVRV